MIRHSLRWKPLVAYGFFAAVFSTGVTAAVVGVYFVRNPGTAVWAFAAAPFYFLAFFLTTAIVIAIFAAARRPLVDRPKLWRQLMLGLLAGLAGICVAFEFWWCIEFEVPPPGVLLCGFVVTALAFGWYGWFYEGDAKAVASGSQRAGGSEGNNGTPSSSAGS